MEKTFEMAGLACEGCASNVRERFESVSGIQSVAVDLSKKTATVTGDATVNRTDLEKALSNTKYTIVNEVG